MSNRFPQFRNLQAFEAAGRLGSFKAAADELSLTPSAISHRISALEAQLEETLFEPRGRGTVLTANGHTYFAAIQRVFDQLGSATDQIKHQGVSGPLTIRVYTTFARGWLIPRLSGFVRQYGEVELNLVVNQAPLDFSSVDTDVVVEYLEAPLPEYRCDVLHPDGVIAVCSPAYQAQHGPFRRIEDLHTATLIHNMHRPDEWSWWLDTATLHDMHKGRHMRVSSRDAAIDSAAAGLGFALAHWPMAESALRSGDVIAPIAAHRTTGFSFYLLSTQERAALPRVAAFRDWMLSEFAGTRRETRHLMSRPHL